MFTGRRPSRGLASLLLVLAAGTASAADRYDPRLRFRTLRTENFDIHAHQGEEAMARRLASIAERARRQLQPVYGVPRGRVQVILVDQTDLSNGWATPVPYNTIEITAVAPPPESVIGNTTDWLDVVFTHEYTHILHLDRSRGFMQGVRRVFGRVPPAFPNGFLPVWQIEGLATFEESRVTGAGRIPAGDFRAIVDVAAAAGRFEPIDRASGGLTDWPGGHVPYAYGAYFHQFLANRYGPERLARLADATAGRLPFFGGRAFKKVFGRSASDLWNEFRESRTTTATAPAATVTDARATRLTRHGFVVNAPGVADNGDVYYGVSNADGFPALMRLRPGGSPERVAWRVAGNRTSVRGEWIVFDQVERVRSVALHSDLFAIRTSGGPVRRLTRSARAADPDLSPDGRQIVCTVQAIGRRALALIDFAASDRALPRVIVDDPESDFSGPRWSPDGRQIVAARRRAGAHELVLIDPASRAVRTLAARTDARLVTPSWVPDGASILFSTDGSSPARIFNVQAADVATGAIRQITDTTGGAQFPELSKDGTLTYVGYTADGFDLFSVPFETSNALPRAPVPNQTTQNRENPENPENPENLRELPYRPWRTLVPTFWTPIVETDAGETLFGAATAMADALGRHGYAVDAGWSGARVRPDWHVAYAYDRWRPTLFASYSDETDPVQDGEVRSRELFAGAQLRLRRVRWTDTLIAGFDAQTDTLRCAAITAACRVASAQRDLRSVRAGWLHDSRRQFGYSISTAEGFAVQIAAESSRTAFGSDANAGAAIFDARAFHRVAGRHAILAARIAGAAAWGNAAVRRVFSAAGSGPSYPSFDFGRDTIGLLRGFAPGDVTGTRATVANLDLRIPLARPQRGAGTWPILLHSVHTAAFVDAGHAWTTAVRAADLRTSIGAELSADLVVLHYVPLTIVGGAAWTRDPLAARRRAALFGRIGYAF
jgi:hypothetical protein